MSHVSPGSARELLAKPPRRRRWRRRVLWGLLALLVLLVVAVVAVVKLQPSQPPLSLPSGAAAPPAGQLDGTWHVTTGSVAGFRVRESFLGLGNDVTGRTSDVTGTAVMATGHLASATFQVRLATLAVNGKANQPQLLQSLDVAAHPAATITLSRPFALPRAFSSGSVVTSTTTAALTLNGTTRPVTVTLSARRDGTVVEAAGSLPVAFADFGIKAAHGYGAFGSLADNGTAEFLMILAPAAAG